MAPQLQALHLRILLGGDDDNRDVADCVVFPDRLQNLLARHHRHQDVQQHQGQGVLVFAHDADRLRPVAGKEQLVFILQHGAENFPVDHLIVDYQDPAQAICGVKLLVILGQSATPLSYC